MCLTDSCKSAVLLNIVETEEAQARKWQKPLDISLGTRHPWQITRVLKSGSLKSREFLKKGKGGKQRRGRVPRTFLEGRKVVRRFLDTSQKTFFLLNNS